MIYIIGYIDVIQMVILHKITMFLLAGAGNPVSGINAMKVELMKRVQGIVS